MKHAYLEIAKLVIEDHMSQGECLFAPNAAEKIADAAMAAKVQTNNEALDYFSRKKAVMNAMECAIKDAEIYCPHEGIDRRVEFGL